MKSGQAASMRIILVPESDEGSCKLKLHVLQIKLHVLQIKLRVWVSTFRQA